MAGRERARAWGKAGVEVVSEAGERLGSVEDGVEMGSVRVGNVRAMRGSF